MKYKLIDKPATIQRYQDAVRRHNAQFVLDGKTVWAGSRMLKKRHYDAFDVLLYLAINRNKPGAKANLLELATVTTSRAEILNLYSVKDSEGERSSNPSKISIWRHLDRLVEVGILEKRAVRGDGGRFRITINPRILVVKEAESAESKIASLTDDYAAQIANCNLHQYPTDILTGEKEKKTTAQAVDNKAAGQSPQGIQKASNLPETSNTGKVANLESENKGPGAGGAKNFLLTVQKIQEWIEAASTNRHQRTNLQLERAKLQATLRTYLVLLGLVFTTTRNKFKSLEDVYSFNFLFIKKLPLIKPVEHHSAALFELHKHFANCLTYEAIDAKAQELNEAAEFARRAILRKHYDISYLTPLAFLRPGRMSFDNVLKKWLPAHKERLQKRATKLAEGKVSLQEAARSRQFYAEADLLLAYLKTNGEATPAALSLAYRYVATHYPKAYSHVFELLLDQTKKEAYTPKGPKSKAHKEFTERVFNSGWILANEAEILRLLNAHMKGKTYTNELATALKFQKPPVRKNAVAVNDWSVVGPLAYKHLIFKSLNI